MRRGSIAVATPSAAVFAVAGYWVPATALVLLVTYVAADVAQERPRDAGRHDAGCRLLSYGSMRS